VTTTRAEVAKTCRTLRDWGQEKRYEHRLKGFNYRMDGIQGAILRVKLRHLEAWTEQRRQVAAWYAEAWTPKVCGCRKRAPAVATCITCLPCGRRSRHSARGAGQTGHSDRHSLSDPGSPAAGARRPWLPRR
jgi:hypothetical protein